MLTIREYATNATVSVKPVRPNTTALHVSLGTFMKVSATVAVHSEHSLIPQSTLALLVKVLAVNAY